MKSFVRLLLSQIKAITDPLLDPLQFAYRASRSVDDAVNIVLHFILQHLDFSGTYARILLVDLFSYILYVYMLCTNIPSKIPCM